MQLASPFIRLPYTFDAERLATEVAALPGESWMNHPSGMKGNAAVALISRNGEDNDDFDGVMKTTPHLESCQYMQQVMATFGEVLARSRLMRLAPSCEVSAHVDFNYHWYTRVRVHIPVVTHSAVLFYCADQVVHMRPGECWIFDSWRRHRVVNGSGHDRIHLVVDMAGSSRFWRKVQAMEALDSVSAPAAFERKLKYVEFDSDKSVTIETEQYNTAPIMAPGEVDALVSELVRDFSANPGNDPVLVNQYRQVLWDFSKDWRETWHRYGYNRSGWPHYRSVIDTVRGALHPDPRALVTQSNQIGVNPIIVQRILRPALSNGCHDHFIGSSNSDE